MAIGKRLTVEIEQNITAVILGVVANGLTALVAKLGKAITDDLTLKSNDPKLDRLLEEAIDGVAEENEWKEDSHARIEEVCLFLNSPEVEGIVRQVFAAKFTAPENSHSIEQIKNEFQKSFAFYLDIEEAGSANATNRLFDALLFACESALDQAIADEVLSAHEAKATLRHRLLQDELASIEKKIDFLARPHTTSISEILEFERQYRKQVEGRHSFIVPPHFDAAKRVPITELYVCPTFSIPGRAKDDDVSNTGMYRFLKFSHRCVVLGNPSGGKSTFATRLCFDLATRYSERLFAGRELTPVLVVLRDFGAAKKEHGWSILEFIESDANSRYQLKAPDDAVEYMLLNGRCLVVLDGLDELIDTHDRREISSDIESFCDLYPEVPIVVTSREVGYQQAPLDESRFPVVRLAPLDAKQIKEYVEKWFSVDKDLTEPQRSKKCESFINESKIVPDLCSNPLMLALMCNIYRGENYIPRNRPDLYEKCAVMLFERWDKSRGIVAPVPFEAHIRPAMMFLAHWIFTSSDMQGGVTEARLVSKATEYLSEKRYEDSDEARHASQAFIEFCRGRAWVFTDTGTTAEGESLYQFTHRTFLEYFAAAHLARIFPTPAKLAQKLIPRIAKSEWDVVAQLSIQIQNKNVEGAGDELLTRVLKSAERRRTGNWNLICFDARCLEFLVPSPTVTRRIVADGLDRWIEQEPNPKKSNGEMPFSNSETDDPVGASFLSSLLTAAAENRSVVEKQIEENLVKWIHGDVDELSDLAIDVLLGLPSSLTMFNRDLDVETLYKSWTDFARRIRNTCKTRILVRAEKNSKIAIRALETDLIEIDQFVAWHGFSQIFSSGRHLMYPTGHLSVATNHVYQLAFQVSRSNYDAQNCKHAAALRKIGVWAISEPLPWFDKFQPQAIYGHWWYTGHGDVARNVDLKLDNPLWFGIFIVLAVESEMHEPSVRQIQNLAQIHPGLHSIARIVHGRHAEKQFDDAEECLRGLSLSEPQRSLVYDWLSGRTRFGPNDRMNN